MNDALYIFDFDDTLAMTNSHVKVIRPDGSIERLDSRKFAMYRSSPGDYLDFSEFNKADGTLIENTVAEMESAIATYGLENVFIVTARSESKPVHDFLDSLGITVPKIIATSGSAGKATWLTKQLSKKDFKSVRVYEDCRKNITMLNQ